MITQANLTGRNLTGRIVRAPLFHFIVIGALLFVLRSALPDDGIAERQSVVVTQQRLAALRSDVERWGRSPSREELSARIEEALDEKLLELEARRQEERSTVRLVEGLERLRELYQVRVEWPATKMASTEVAP